MKMERNLSIFFNSVNHFFQGFPLMVQHLLYVYKTAISKENVFSVFFVDSFCNNPDITRLYIKGTWFAAFQKGTLVAYHNTYIGFI